MRGGGTHQHHTPSAAEAAVGAGRSSVVAPGTPAQRAVAVGVSVAARHDHTTRSLSAAHGGSRRRLCRRCQQPAGAWGAAAVCRVFVTRGLSSRTRTHPTSASCDSQRRSHGSPHGHSCDAGHASEVPVKHRRQAERQRWPIIQGSTAHTPRMPVCYLSTPACACKPALSLDRLCCSVMRAASTLLHASAQLQQLKLTLQQAQHLLAKADCHAAQLLARVCAPPPCLTPAASKAVSCSLARPQQAAAAAAAAACPQSRVLLHPLARPQALPAVPRPQAMQDEPHDILQLQRAIWSTELCRRRATVGPRVRMYRLLPSSLPEGAFGPPHPHDLYSYVCLKEAVRSCTACRCAAPRVCGGHGCAVVQHCCCGRP
jgi:hypothetical protein